MLIDFIQITMGVHLKYALLIILFIVMVLYGCREFNRNNIKEFIPGTYIRFSQHEFGIEYDTLVISIQNQSTGEYRVTRKWKYERVVDGTNIEPEYKRTVTSCIYDSVHKLLKENETGGIYSFDTKDKVLFNGPVKYQKL